MTEFGFNRQFIARSCSPAARTLGHFGHWGYLTIFLVVALECQAVLGFFMPGESLVLLGGFFAEQGVFDR